MSDEGSITKEETPTPRTNASARPLLLVAIVLAGLSIISACVLGWYTHKLNGEIDDLQFSLATTDYQRQNDSLSPDVGAIQFMHRGYTITFDTLSYTSSGLEVTGTLGNTTQVTLSSINLRLSARPFLYKSRDKVISDPYFVYSGAGEIGSGQTSIVYLPPGKTATFTMTIPNVKQTQEGFEIIASFSGERYSYY